jgi:hypothetical protein
MYYDSIDFSEFEVAQLVGKSTDEYVPIGCVVNYWKNMRLCCYVSLEVTKS